MAPPAKHTTTCEFPKAKKSLFDDNEALARLPEGGRHAFGSVLVGTALGSEPAEDSFGVNRTYAFRYDAWRRKEEQQRLKSKYGDEFNADDDDDESSSTDESDEGDDVLAPAEDIDFLRALSLVKKKDPRVYSKSFQIFPAIKVEENDVEVTDDASASLQKRKTKSKIKDRPFTLADYEVKIAIEKGGDLADEDADDKAGYHIREFENETEIRDKFSYDDEQRATKQEFLAALHTDDAQDTNKADESNVLLVKRLPTVEERQEEEKSYLLWLQGKRTDVGPDDATALDAKKDLQHLHDYWTDPELDEGEQFLRDYILNKRYLGDEDETEADSSKSKQPATRVFQVPDVKDVVSEMEADTKELEREEEFEQKFNFRFEEPDPDFIKRYPRTIGDSVRAATQPVNARKVKRENARERQQREQQQRRDEIRQYKTMVKQEVVEKIQKLKQIAGNDALDITFEELEADFDPAEYDKKMEQLFGNDYYDVATGGGERTAEEEKPVFSDESDVEADWDTYDLKRGNLPVGENSSPSFGSTTKSRRNAGKELVTNVAEQLSADGEPRKEKKAKRQSKFARILEKPDRPAFDPSSDKTFEEYFNDYCKLDCEDVIAGGKISCRFHYRKTQPNNFGLTAEEILLAPENELNAWVSLKRVVAQRDNYEEERDDRMFKQMAKSEFKKKKKLPSLFGRQDAATTESGGNELDDAEVLVNETAEDADQTATSANDVGENDAEIKPESIAVEAGANTRRERRRRQKNLLHEPLLPQATEIPIDVVENVTKMKPENTGEEKPESVICKKRRLRNRKSTLAELNGEKQNSAGHSKPKRQRYNAGSKPVHHQREHQKPLTEAVRQHPVFQLSDERLKAYGLNPKKIRNRVQYGAE